MIYSSSKNFLFIHVPKTAGTSIRSVLQPYGGHPGAINFIARRLEFFPNFCNVLGLNAIRTYDSHTTYKKVSEILSAKALDNAFKFAFVRHPLDRLYSFYLHILAHPDHPWYKKINDYGSFSTMIKNLDKVQEPTQLSYLTDKQGNFNVDFVGRLENINEDFEFICSKIGVPFDLPKKNARKHKDWREAYTSDEDIELAKKFYQEDFDQFGYETAL
ncbi:sulfotransferase family 2 domain-containing protein [Flavobacterium rhizosphaerae]|uniref:Sulfotransferase family 2 domain-containing protein n=1 Tax=Flavobacterium rhizosphaerae TaxID=3163298 RepID=A0ABW8YZR4_9FLAO